MNDCTNCEAYPYSKNDYQGHFCHPRISEEYKKSLPYKILGNRIIVLCNLKNKNKDCELYIKKKENKK